ncbi:nickel/cobalt transporter [Methyloferula stellata]|uniref:nickel/cobalt transporter n=1 Tax=Methyloferula stellata TaxID=876270 RepID=UPI001AEC1B97|nr:nickel/cobalt transporter [Methyloferula stellata]
MRRIETLDSLAAGLALGFITLIIFSCDGAFAQGAHHPFAVGANEGAVGNVSGFGAWIIGQESVFYRQMTQALHAIKAHESAGWALAGVSFAYGVFHAAGPGHGKAVVTSYMVSNERALRRGLVISLLAAVLQGLVAVGLVGIAALIFHATAQRMTAAANLIETASYFGIVALGVLLLWRKGAAFATALSAMPRAQDHDDFGFNQSKIMNVIDSYRLERDAGGKPVPTFPHPALEEIFAASAPSLSTMGRGTSAFFADNGAQDHVHGPDCGHFLAMDPTKLDEGFVWKGALLTMLTAGARPCSGAILVLVFALAQDMFLVGVGATFAMSLGTAITTGALAAFAVYAKRTAVKFAGPGSPRALVFGRLIEVGAALLVLLFGCALLAAQWMGFTLTAL